MAARFGAKIVPFGVVGEDDFGEVRSPIDSLFYFICFHLFISSEQCSSV
jgi:hypothetical protein